VQTQYRDLFFAFDNGGDCTPVLYSGGLLKSSSIDGQSRQRDFAKNVSIYAPTSFTSSAERSTDLLWTTGSERRPRYWERRSDSRSKQQRDRSSWSH
jgi:hypothetical protein